jgi:hypothetical protein
MASILYGALVSDLAGKVGGQNFQRGLASPSIRNISTKRKKFNVVPVGNAILAIRGRFAYVTRSWRSLSSAQQSLWASATSLFPRTNKFGVTYYPSAYQLFVELSLGLNFIGSAIATSAPAVSAFVVPSWSISYAGGGGSILITQAPAYTTVPYKTIIRASVYQSNGLAYIPSRLKILTHFQFKSSAPSLEISSFFYAMFGPALAGTTAYFSVNQINVNTGEEDVRVLLSVLF